MGSPQPHLKFVKKLLGKNEHLKSNISGINGDPISVVVLVIVGVILWLINSYIPMDAKIKKILNVVVVIVVIIWLLQAFGILGNLRI